MRPLILLIWRLLQILLWHKTEFLFPHLFKAHSCVIAAHCSLTHPHNKTHATRAFFIKPTPYLNAVGEGITQILAQSTFNTARSTKVPLINLQYCMVSPSCLFLTSRVLKPLKIKAIKNTHGSEAASNPQRPSEGG